MLDGFDAISADGKTAYRVGYRDVIDQADPGIGLTDISTSTASTKWIDDIPLPSGLDFYMSLNLYGDSFLSLAPDDLTQDIRIVEWGLSNATVLAVIEDGYNTPYFGPLLEYINVGQTTYGAFVVYDSVFTDLDSWAFVVTDLTTGETNELVLWPLILAQITSVSGLGFA